MPYEPLHHKYRPQSFAELVGQRAIAATLSNALHQQRIAPAYLFTGPRGTGKTSSARILSKSLNCIASDVPTSSPCGVCDTCRAITTGSALDVIEIDAASNTGVDNIRELIERAQFAPVQCRYKVYVIDEVHMLSVAAFNALLKTLEEPPDRVVFVLATTDPQKVLPTIISRCQRFDFRRIPLEDMVDHLGTIATKESIQITRDAIQLVAQISQGGLRDAESLLDQLSLLDGEITVERVWDLVGAVPERDLLTLMRAIAQDDAAAVLDQARHLMNRGREPLIVLQNLASFYRDLLIAKTSPDRSDLVALTPPTWVELCDFAQSFDVSAILVGQQHLRESEAQVKNTTQPRLWLEVTLMGLLPSAIASQSVAAHTSTVPTRPTISQGSQSTLVQRAGQPTNAVPTSPKQTVQAATPPAQASPVAPAPEPIPPAPAPPQPERPEPSQAPHPAEPEEPPSDRPVEVRPAATHQIDLEQIWQEILTLVQPYSTQIMLRQQCSLLAFNGKDARIGTKSQPLFKMAKDRLPNVEAAFAKQFNQPVRVSLEVIAAESVATTVSEAPSAYNPSTNAPPPSAPSSQPVPRPDSPTPTHNGHSNAAPPVPIAAASRPTPSPIRESVPDVPIEAERSPALQVGWQEEDEVVQAAKSLAQMFNGQIVNLDDPIGIDRDTVDFATNLSEAEVGEDSDDDVPF